MKEELKQLNKKLDGMSAEVKELKALLLSLTNPPSTPVKKYKVSEAAAYLRLSVARVYDLVYTGKLLPIQRQKYSRLLFTTEQLNQFLYDKEASTEAEHCPANLSPIQL
jgi:hypothetical protein